MRYLNVGCAESKPASEFKFTINSLSTPLKNRSQGTTFHQSRLDAVFVKSCHSREACPRLDRVRKSSNFYEYNLVKKYNQLHTDSKRCNDRIINLKLMSLTIMKNTYLIINVFFTSYNEFSIVLPVPRYISELNVFKGIIEFLG